MFLNGNPLVMTEYLSRDGHIENIYKVMANNDLSEVVMTVLEALSKTGAMAPIIKTTKSENVSNRFREQGNTAYKAKLFNTALGTYNLAIAHAPKNSLAMKRAYYNRSSVLYTTENYTECLKDIEICLSLDYKVENLNIRKEGCLNKIKLKFKGVIPNGFIKEFFKFEVCRNPHIPCASADIDVVWEQGGPKVIAAKDIVAGTVVALETAFVSLTTFPHRYMSCSYCQKTSLNLIPCDTCHYLMFCSTDCKNNCLEEYHLVDCQFIDFVEKKIDHSPVLSFRLALKLRNKFDSWEQFIATSNDIGHKRLNASTFNEIYDGNNKYSSFAWKDTELNILYGKIYNYSFFYAAVIYYLAAIPSYYPEDVKERQMAMRSMARVMMHFQMMNPYLIASQVIPSNGKADIVHSGFGYFPFISKLTKTCDSNLLGVPLNNKMALIAISSIKKGTELTFSRRHWTENEPYKERVTAIYHLYYYVCKCRICKENWQPSEAPCKYNSFSILQKKYFSNLNYDSISSRSLVDRNVEESHFRKLCSTIDNLSNFKFSKEYMHVFRTLMICLTSLQITYTNNTFLEDNE